MKLLPCSSWQPTSSTRARPHPHERKKAKRRERRRTYKRAAAVRKSELLEVLRRGSAVSAIYDKATTGTQMEKHSKRREIRKSEQLQVLRRGSAVSAIHDTATTVTQMEKHSKQREAKHKGQLRRSELSLGASSTSLSLVDNRSVTTEDVDTSAATDKESMSSFCRSASSGEKPKGPAELRTHQHAVRRRAPTREAMGGHWRVLRKSLDETREHSCVLLVVDFSADPGTLSEGARGCGGSLR